MPKAIYLNDKQSSKTADMYVLLLIGLLAAAQVVNVAAEKGVVKGSHWVVIPDKYTPGSSIPITFSFFNTSADVTVQVDLIRDDHYRVSTLHHTFVDAQSEILQIAVPDENPNPKTYTILINGLAGVYFQDHGILHFDSGEMPEKFAVHIQTDKGIYKPGQTIHFRTFGVSSDMRVYTGLFNIHIEDPKGNVMKNMINVSESQYGVVEDFLIMDTEPVLGKWKIVSTAMNYYSHLPQVTETKYFTVDKYVLPKFEVSVELPPYVVTRDKEMHGTVKAKYTYGKPVIGTVKVYADVDYYDTPWKYHGDEVMVEVSFDINGEAKFTIPFSRITNEVDPNSFQPLVEKLAGYHLTIKASVTESINNITRNATAQVLFYQEPYKVVFDHSSSMSFFKPGLPYIGHVTITQANGNPVISSTEEVRLVSYVKFLDPNTHKYRAQYLAEQRYPAPPTGVLEVVVDPPVNTTSLHLEVFYQGLHDELNVNKPYWLLDNGNVQLSQNTSSVVVGKPVTFDLKRADGINHIPIFYAVIANDRMVHSGVVHNNASSDMQITFLITDKMKPYGKLVVYYFDTDVWNADALIFDVHEDSDKFKNKVAISFDQQTAEPGENVSLSIRTDPQSLVNLLAVDQSVLLLASGNDITQGDTRPEPSAPPPITEQTTERRREPVLFHGKMATVLFFFVYLLLGVHAQTQDILRLNQGVQFANPKPVHFVINEWTHTVKFHLPKQIDFGNNITLCQQRLYSEKGCPLSIEIGTLIKHLKSEATMVLKTLDGIIPHIQFDTKGKRNGPILGFVGDLGSTLFGIATTSQLDVLRSHINQLTKVVNNVTHVFSQSENGLSSFIHHVNAELKNFDEFVANEKDIVQNILLALRSNERTHEVAETIILRYTEQIAEIRAHFNNLLKGIQMLNSGKLSSYIVPAEQLQTTLDSVSNILTKDFDSYQLISKDAAFYYQNAKFIYGRQKDVIYVSIMMPIVRKGKFNMFEINMFPIPLNNDFNNSDASVLVENARNLIIYDQDQSYAILQKHSLKECVQFASFMLCYYDITLTNNNVDNCIMELYNYNNITKVNALCNQKMVRNILKPDLKRLSQDTILAIQQKGITMECIGQNVTIVSDCKFCVLTVPCGCRLVTKTHSSDMHFSKCKLQVNESVEVVHPINMQYLRYFFSDSILSQLMENSSQLHPSMINLPQYRMYEHKSQEIQAKTKQIEISLEHLAEKAKSNSFVYSNLAESLLDDEYLTSNSLLNNLLVYVGLAISILNTLCLVWLYRKMNLIILTTTLLRQVNALELKYTTTTTQSPYTTFFNTLESSLKFEHFIFGLVLLHLIIGIWVLRKLYCNKHPESTYLNIHVSNGIQCLDIPLVSISSCPIEWNIISNASILIEGIVGTWYPKVLFDTSRISVTNKITNVSLPIPTSKRINWILCLRLKKMLKTTYFTRLEVVHNGIRTLKFSDILTTDRIELDNVNGTNLRPIV